MATDLYNLIVDDQYSDAWLVPGNRMQTANNIIDRFAAYTSGTRQASVRCEYDAVKASGTVTISGGSGSITATINGIVSTVTWATSDTVTAGLLAAKIVAGGDTPDNLVLKQVTAANVAGVVTITALSPGFSGNAITLAADGTGASASGTRLTAGTATQATFTYP